MGYLGSTLGRNPCSLSFWDLVLERVARNFFWESSGDWKR